MASEMLTGGSRVGGPLLTEGAGLQCRFPWYREEQSPLPPQPCGWTPSLTRGLPDPGNQAQVFRASQKKNRQPSLKYLGSSV